MCGDRNTDPSMYDVDDEREAARAYDAAVAAETFVPAVRQKSDLRPGRITGAAIYATEQTRYVVFAQAVARAASRYGLNPYEVRDVTKLAVRLMRDDTR